jgi:drug/metabolite transporter (DMT)-like permease
MEKIFEFSLLIPPSVLVMVSALLMIVGDYYAKKWSLKQKMIFFLFLLFFTLVSSGFYIASLLQAGLVVTSMLYTVIAMSGHIIMGTLIFKERLTRRQIIGVILGCISIISLSISIS